MLFQKWRDHGVELSVKAKAPNGPKRHWVQSSAYPVLYSTQLHSRKYASYPTSPTTLHYRKSKFFFGDYHSQP